MGAPKPLQKDPAPSRDPAEAQGRFIEPYSSQDGRFQNPCPQKKVLDRNHIYRLGLWGGVTITLMIFIWVTLNGPPRGPQVTQGFPELKLTNTPGQDPSSPRRRRSFFKKEIVVTTHPKDSFSVTSVWGQQRDESLPKHMLHISATVDSPATFRVDLRTLLKCPLSFGCFAEGFGCNQWYLQALDDQGLYQQGWKGTFAHTSYAEVYWPLSPEAYEWKKMIQNLRMGHDDRGNPYFICTSNKVGEELVYAAPSQCCEREFQRQPGCRFGPSSVVLPSYQDQGPPISTSPGRSMVAVRPTYLPLSVFHVAWTMCTSHRLRPHLCCIWRSKFIKPNHQEVTTRPRDGTDVPAPRRHLGIQCPRGLQTLLHDRQSHPIPTALVRGGESPTPC